MLRLLLDIYGLNRCSAETQCLVAPSIDPAERFVKRSIDRNSHFFLLLKVEDKEEDQRFK